LSNERPRGGMILLRGSFALCETEVHRLKAAATGAAA
jgi:hypothetical protein